MKKRNAIMLALVTIGVSIAELSSPCVRAQTSDAQSAIAKSVGTIKSVSGNMLTLSPTSGPEVPVTVKSNARMLRIAPGDKDLKNATPIHLGDLKVGDLVRARGHATANGIDALEIVVISSSTIDAVKEQVRQDWQKRGVGGLVDSVDIASGNINLSIPGLAGKKILIVQTSKTTVVHRYSPESAKPEDAKLVTLQDIQVGDQLRARGNRNTDGTEMTAEEIYSGVFPQFAAVVKSIDASAGIVSVQDLTTKKTVQVKITADSQLHKIPPEMAQGFAMGLKARMSPGTPGAAPKSGGGSAPPPAAHANVPAPAGGGAAWRRGGGGPPDLSRMLSRLPASTLAELDLKKGDALYILATEGTPTGARTAITLLSGVEPILQAAPNASQAMMLTPWTLGGAPGGDAAQ